MSESIFRVTMESGESFEVPEGERILAAARRADVWLPFECGWGSCGTCKVTVVEGSVEQLYADAPAISPRDTRRRKIITCQTTPVTDMVLRATRVSGEPADHLCTADHRARLVAIEELGPSLRRFEFEFTDEVDFREGQYAVLDFGGGLRRCYSLASRPGGRRGEFIAKHYPGGAGSTALFDLVPGAEIGMELPFGDMWLRADDRPIVMLAGGTGISAILALARQLAATGDSRPVRVLYGARAPRDLACNDEMAALVESLPQGRYHPIVAETDERWTGPTGFVTDLVDDHLALLAEARAYLAGPPVMVDSALSALGAAGVRIDRIHYDRFG